MYGPEIDDEPLKDQPPPSSPFASKRPSFFQHSNQGSQEDIIPIDPADNSKLMAATGGLEDMEMDQKVKKGKFKVDEFNDHILLCFLDPGFPDGISSFMVFYSFL